MRVLAATLTLLVSSAASAQECKTCSMADACIKTYLKAASEAQTATTGEFSEDQSIPCESVPCRLLD
jgi:hypothetical protein